MLKSRAKIRRTQDKTCFMQASIADSDHQSTRSGALIGSNNDLLTEIFLRLPVISIVRFKSVSKHWRSLLSDRRFTLLYDKVSVSSGLFVRNLFIPFDVGSQNDPPFRSLDYHDRRCIIIMQSCNGLLLWRSNRGKEHTRKYYVINPTTMQSAVIPPIIGGPSASKTICFMGLAFHQANCVHYKVICFRKAKPFGNLFQIQICSGTWRISNESFFSSDLYTSDGAYWNGAILWVPSSDDLLYFKLDVEQVQKLSLPEQVNLREMELQSTMEVRGITRPLYIGKSGGHLHLVKFAPNESNLC